MAGGETEEIETAQQTERQDRNEKTFAYSCTKRVGIATREKMTCRSSAHKAKALTPEYDVTDCTQVERKTLAMKAQSSIRLEVEFKRRAGA